MKKLNYELKELCRSQKEGSYATQVNRYKNLQLVANQLVELGYRNMRCQSLKPKHIDGLVSLWQSQGISTGTLKNRLSYLRWWAKKVNKSDMMAKDNRHYGIEQRQLVSQQSKACQIDQTMLSKITSPYVKLSLQLQQIFGLRREEAIKCIPSFADHGDHLLLKASWTKGGKARTFPPA